MIRATIPVIRQWLNEAPKDAAYMVVMCDVRDTPFWFDYPRYVPHGQDPRKHAGGDMQKPMECYDLSKDLESQLSEFRANHWGDEKTSPEPSQDILG